MAEMSGIDAAAYSSQGTERESVSLPGEMFDGTVNNAVMHQVVKAHLANMRQGTHKTKTRGFVTGGNQKPWRQKGTGRARQGSTRAPQWPGGGTVFGPIPRSYNQDIPRKLKMLARKSAFNARARENSLLVIDAFVFDAPKTSRIRSLLDRLEINGRKVLILTHGLNRNVYLSGRNIPNVQVMPFDEASTYDLLRAHVVLVEGAALGHKLEPIAEREPAARTPRAKVAKKAEGGAKKEAKAKSAPRGQKRKATTRRAPAKKASAAGSAKKKAAKKATPKRAAARPKRKEK
jgi:large subunit ribosomal protein L4